MKRKTIIGRTVIGLIAWVILSLSVGYIGSQFMPGEWYSALAKPVWTPPNYVFAPVWTVLYILMGAAAWLVWKKAGFSGAMAPLILFLVQLALNAFWSYLFFGMHQPMLAFFEIIILWIIILVTIMLFWKISPLAGTLLIPYLCWVGFASVLNFYLWRLNA